MHNGPKGNQDGKAKDFKSAIKRLAMELHSYKVLIIVALVLAALGSVLSILAPEELSSLTDEITKGLVVNTDNLTTLSNHLSSSLNEEEIAKKIPEILDIQLTEQRIKEILSSDHLSKEEKTLFQSSLGRLQTEEKFKVIQELPDNILNEIFE